jgi:hypothetical protein
MHTRELVHRHINSLPLGTLFATRDLLHYGLRCSIDQMMYVMVKAGDLLRLARGIFMKPPMGDFKLPTAFEIAAAKAKAFGKEILTHGIDAAHAMKILESKNSHTTFSVNGRTTSFWSVHGRIYFEGTNSKDIKKANNPVALIVRALKQKNVELTLSVLEKATSGLMRTERNQLKQDLRWMPGWMSDAFIKFWYGHPRRRGGLI